MSRHGPDREPEVVRPRGLGAGLPSGPRAGEEPPLPSAWPHAICATACSIPVAGSRTRNPRSYRWRLSHARSGRWQNLERMSHNQNARRPPWRARWHDAHPQRERSTSCGTPAWFHRLRRSQQGAPGATGHRHRQEMFDEVGWWSCHLVEARCVPRGMTRSCVRSCLESQREQ